MFLQSNDNFSKLAEYDPSNGKYTLFTRNESTDYDCEGYFSLLSKQFATLYCYDKTIFININGCIMQLNNNIHITLTGDRSERRLQVFSGDQFIASLNYQIDGNKLSSYDLTAFVTNEDEDFGLFIMKIANDRQRQSILLDL
jgi:hypothetical protein